MIVKYNPQAEKQKFWEVWDQETKLLSTASKVYAEIYANNGVYVD